MQRELPVGDGLVAAAGAARSMESEAHVRTDTAPGRREMNVAVLKTKAEQSLAEAFSGIAAELPGGPRCARCAPMPCGGSERSACRIGASKRGNSPTCAT